MNLLQIEHLSKKFGSNHVIRDVSFSVPEHSVFGFLGQNGAGKTTTMKIILGLLKADHGRVQVCGETAVYGRTGTNRNIGYLPDVPEFYNYMKAREYLQFCGEITGMPKALAAGRSGELLDLVGLSGGNKKIGGYSRGMKQRLGIAQALLNEPKLLICDEPTSALDPVGRKEILDILGHIKGKTTVLFSTHILSDVERICDNIAVLHQGELALCGTLEEIKAQHRQDGLLIEFTGVNETRLFRQSPELLPYLNNAELSDTRIVLHANDLNAAWRAVIAILYSTKLIPAKCETLEPTLESLFMEVVQ